MHTHTHTILCKSTKSPNSWLLRMRAVCTELHFPGLTFQLQNHKRNKVCKSLLVLCPALDTFLLRALFVISIPRYLYICFVCKQHQEFRSAGRVRSRFASALSIVKMCMGVPNERTNGLRVEMDFFVYCCSFAVRTSFVAFRCIRQH